MVGTAIAVFAKTLGFSQVKTRLAKNIGRDDAERFYSACVLETKAQLEKFVASSLVPSGLAEQVSLFWAVAEKEALHHPQYSSWNTIWQGDGGLAERLIEIERQLFRKGFSSVMFYGTDSPHIDIKVLGQALQLISTNDVVIGPAEDGGFYLLLTRKPLGADVWSGVPYSSADTCEKLVAEIRMKHPMLKVEFLDQQFDIDTEDEMHRALEVSSTLRRRVEPQFK